MSNLLNVPLDHPFSIDNIPFGVYADASAGKARCATRLGDHVIDLQQLVEAGLLQGAASETFNKVGRMRNDFALPLIPSIRSPS